nr:MAG TPA: hypothetical protein [Microviridae sp.]
MSYAPVNPERSFFVSFVVVCSSQSAPLPYLM